MQVCGQPGPHRETKEIAFESLFMSFFLIFPPEVGKSWQEGIS